jgi:hypothetical protein
MKRLFRIADLTKNEQRVVLIVILILITIAFVEYGRRLHHSPVESALATQPKPSPTAVQSVGDE